MKTKTLALFIFFTSFLFSQSDTPEFSKSDSSDLKIFLNCRSCDQDYIKQNLGMVEFVRDQKFADVNLLFRTQRNGSGGTSFEIDFLGQNTYKDMKDTLTFTSNGDATRNEVNGLIIRYIKIGLLRFWVKNGNEKKISVQINDTGSKKNENARDPWNKWVFNVGINGFFYGQETSKESNMSYTASVKRVTKENKFYLQGRLNKGKSTFTYDSDTIVSKRKSNSLQIYDVISIDNHWSAGVFSRFGESTYMNYSFYSSLKPAIEYNLFSYENSSKKQLTLSYKAGPIYNNYNEKTIFGKDNELLWEHDFMLGGSVEQKWGNISGEVSYSSFLHDFNLNEFNFNLGANLRIVKGLSFTIRGQYGITNNQINLDAGDLSLEELLLRQQQVSSGFNYFISTGISYSFGSIYNSIVNPRFNF